MSRQSNRRPAVNAIAIFLLVLSGCSSLPENSGDGAAEEIFDPAGRIRAVDARADFRQVYCSINETRGASMPDYRTCDDAFRQVSPEAKPSRDSIPSNLERTRFTVLFAPGLGYDCFTNLIGDIESLRAAAESQGHDVIILPIKGLGDAAENARIIRDAVVELDSRERNTRLLLMGYSKGTNDVLAALTRYPELAQRVAAVVGVSSAIGGSYLAEHFDLWALNLLAHLPGAKCEPPGEHILENLHPDVRRDWLARHELPGSVRYFSMVTFPKTDRISSILKSAFRDLAEYDVRNDGQVLIIDQVIPGSEVLGFANADHWAIALPISRTKPVIGSTAVNRNDFPREVLLQAILEYVGIELDRPRAE